MRILAIDPGPEKSGAVLWDSRSGRVVMSQREYDNRVLREDLEDGTRFDWLFDGTEMVVFEKIESMGMTVGETVFESVFWTGRLFESAVRWAGCARVSRRQVKLHLCGNPRAKDANIRQALIDKLGGPAALDSGRCRECGGKGWKGRGRPTCAACKGTGNVGPGALFGVSSHAWSALALAVVWFETNETIQAPMRRLPGLA